jgi:UDPglucose 6-dehydrogenase
MIANLLAKEGAVVSVYDPQAINDSLSKLDKTILIKNSISYAIKDSCAIFIATDWDEFKEFSLKDYAQAMNKQIKLFVDCMNIFDVKSVELSGLQYVGIGRNSFKNKLGGTSDVTSKTKISAS